MMIKKLKRLPVCLLVLLFSIFALVPFYMMLIMGTHYSEDLFSGIKMLPGGYLIQNLRTVLKQNFFYYYRNSIIVSVCNTVCGVLVSALTGYTFAKFQFKGKKLLFAFVVSTLAVPQQLGLIGFVVEMRFLGWNDTLLPLIVSGVANAFGVFWMKQYIESAVPNELLESGRVDGCRELGVFLRLVLPVIRPALITIFLLLFLWSWNSYLTPLVLITSQKNYTIPLSIALISSEYRTDYAARILALAMSTVPIILLFTFGSKYLIRGLMAGSVKG